MEHKTYIICSAINYKGHIIAGRRHSDAELGLIKEILY